MFFASRTLEGLGAAAVIPALLAYFTVNTRHNRPLRTRVMSYFELTLLCGLGLGGLVASALFNWLNARAFIAVALLYLACAALLFFSTRHGDRRHPQSPLAALDIAWQLPSLRHLAPVWLCVNCILGLWLGSTLPYLLTRCSAANQFLSGIFSEHASRVGIVLLGCSAVFAVGVILWSFVLPRISLRLAMRITLGAMLPVCVGLYLFNHTPATAGAARWILGSMAALCIMVESGFTPAALGWLAGTLPPESGRGAAMGIYSVLLSLGAIVGSLLAGVLGQQFAIDGLLYGTVLIAIAALIFLHRVPDEADTGEFA